MTPLAITPEEQERFNALLCKIDGRAQSNGGAVGLYTFSLRGGWWTLRISYTIDNRKSIRKDSHQVYAVKQTLSAALDSLEAEVRRWGG